MATRGEERRSCSVTRYITHRSQSGGSCVTGRPGILHFPDGVKSWQKKSPSLCSRLALIARPRENKPKEEEKKKKKARKRIIKRLLKCSVRAAVTRARVRPTSLVLWLPRTLSPSSPPAPTLSLSLALSLARPLPFRAVACTQSRASERASCAAATHVRTSRSNPPPPLCPLAPRKAPKYAGNPAA